MSKLLLIFAVISWKYKKCAIFWHFNDYNPGSKHDNYTNDFIFHIYSLSSICWWYISFLHFKSLKIQFHGVFLLHSVLVCKIFIYMPKMTLSSLLTKIPFFYRKVANFFYITFFVSNLIPIWYPWANKCTFQIHQSFSAQVIQWFFYDRFYAGIRHFTLVLTTRFLYLIGNH